MKILSIAVPSYNSQDYLDRCMASLLKGGPDVEIIIVDDGSTDRTPQIADGYAAKYPDIVKVIHKPNGGHGDAVTAGLYSAAGVFFKVCDSDDSFAEDAYRKIVAFLKNSVEENRGLDMLISNFIYDKQGVPEWRKKVISYRGMFPANRYFTWDDAKPAKVGHYILMHSVIYRTQMLRDMGLRLPKHTFYVDNLYVYEPLEHVKTMYYLNVTLYRYYIGRSDQSVNTEVMKKRIDQQERVNRMMFSYRDLEKVENKRVADYMYKYLEVITMITGILCDLIGTEESAKRREKLWADFQKENYPMWQKMHHDMLGKALTRRGKFWHRNILPAAYKAGQFFFGYN
ncbi:MAG: glycosyltransferase [Lachnospiraceae bacterium]|jgi:glycosyltransferase involved in cell wall biosynthesis